MHPPLNPTWKRFKPVLAPIPPHLQGIQPVHPSFEGMVHERYRPPVGHLPWPGKIVHPDHPDPEQARYDMQVRMEALKEVHLRLARRSFPAFMEYCFIDSSTGRPYNQQWFHDEWAAAMSAHDRLIIIAPRDHGKTSQIVGRAIWELGRDPNLRIKIACASDGRAKERLFEITQNMMYNRRVQEVFPGLEPDDAATWNVHKIHVKRTARHRDASIEAMGITSTATGGRCDLLIADDVVDRRNALAFPALREQIKLAWLSDWTNLLEPDSRVLDICTLWHKDDLNHMLMKNSEYHTEFYAIDHGFASMWPEKWPEAALRRRYREIGTVEFNRGFRNQAVDTDSAIVQSSWLRYADLAKERAFQESLDDLAFFTSYDTAATPTGGKEQDFTACCVIAIDLKDHKIYVVDAWHGRMSLKKQADRVFQEYRQYLPHRILIEKVGQASLDEWVLNEHMELAGMIEVTHPKVSKATRLLAVTPLMERGDVIFASHLNPDAEGWNPARGSLIHELQDFPFGKHDDMVDAFSQALHAARRYFLDAWANDGDNTLDVRIGTQGEEESPYLFW